MMVSHLSGQEHMRREKPTQRWYCDVCMVDVSSEETLKAHMKGNSHLRKALLVERERKEKAWRRQNEDR